MAKGCVWASLAGLLLGLVAVLGAQGKGPNEPPETSWLKITLSRPREKSPVRFSHLRHAEPRVACTRCHHEYQRKRNLWTRGQPVKKCRSCHGPLPQAGRPDLKSAFHRQCKGCHLKTRQPGQRAGPINCLDCHRLS